MTSLHIHESDIPALPSKVAIITGGSSGIGLATARILAARGATVHILDLDPIFDNNVAAPSAQEEGMSVPSDQTAADKGSIVYQQCDVTSWPSLCSAFESIPHIDIAVANAGVSEECDYFTDTFDASGKLEEPRYNVLNVNYRAVLNFIKLSLRAFRRQQPGGGGGSLVITTSATAYSPEQSLPVYSATKLALIGLIRALRSTIHLSGATINAVAPAATITRLLPADLAKPILAAGAPVSNAHHVGLAVAYSATATQEHQVEKYGKDLDEKVRSKGRWNGRVILTLGDTWTEVEESISALRSQWMGEWQTEMTAFQQCLTDFRPE